MDARIARVTIYPVKSLDGVELHEVTLLKGAGIAGDREYCIADADGQWVNGKRTPLIHGIRGCNRVSEDRQPVEQALSEALGMAVHLERDPDKGFPDDPEAPGPTVISTASLREVARWFEIEDLDKVRRRFRANIEIDGVPAFWEDSLIGEFLIGDVAIEGTNPCARCVVPTRDPDTGGVLFPDFARRFAELRQRYLPAWSDRSFFNHHYRLALNTRVPESEAGKTIRVGMPVEKAATGSGR